MVQGQDNIVLSISGLTKRFDSLTAVDNLSFDVIGGEIFGILGPNGAGKTTTISMICGLLEPSSGIIEYTGHNGKNNARKLIGYCPQENIYYPKLTCLEQLVFTGSLYGLGNLESRRSAWNLLDFMGLSDKTNILASRLSGGMKRRLNLCLALIHDPGILVLDEPEAGLDPQSRVMVRNFIKSLAGEKTIIITTHNMDEADRLADRIAIIDYGKLLLLDTPENLKKSIGEGDIMELELNSDALQVMDTLVNRLKKVCREVKTGKGTILLKSNNLVESIPAIMSIIKEQGYTAGEIKLRENSLEDVFIYLTGRKLRQ